MNIYFYLKNFKKDENYGLNNYNNSVCAKITFINSYLKRTANPFQFSINFNLNLSSIIS